MSKNGFFHSYFYGRPGQADYTEANMPQNRRALFHEVLRARRGSLVGVNLLYLVFWLPAVFWTFLNLIQLAQGAPPDAATHGKFWDQLFYSWLLVLAPLVAITGPFNMGVSYVLRNWARDEHAFPFGDFKAALKANWKQGLLFGLVDGLAPLVSYICVRFYAGMARSSALFYLPMAIMLMVALLWFLTAPILPTMIVTYRQGFGGILRNGLIMTLAALPRSIALRLMTLAVPLLVFVLALAFPASVRWIAPIALVLYAVFLLAYNKLVWASHANALCESYLNPKIEGARVNIGLRPRNEDE